MKHLLPLLTVAALAHAQQAVAPRIITIRVAPDAYFRAHDEAELMPLLTRDFEDMGRGRVDVGLRRRINVIAARLRTEE